MKPVQVELLTEAEDSIEAAEALLERGFPGYAAARAYYAMFYIACAFLEGEGLQFSKHSGVIGAFGRDFTKTGRVPTKFQRYLVEGLEVRHQGDYGPRLSVTAEQAQEQIARAAEFLEMAREHIEETD